MWLLPVGRDVDAFHGIAQNTSTAAVGYEGYLFWAAAAAIVAPTTLYAVFLIKPPTLGAYRSAAQKCLTLIAFWAFAAAALRVVDYLIALSLDLPRALYDSVAMTAFNLITGFIARWLQRQLAKGEATSTVIAAFSGVLFVFTVANLAIGVALAPRYAETAARRHLRQQPGPADHQHVRRRHLRAEPRRPGRHAVHRAVGRLPAAPPCQPSVKCAKSTANPARPPGTREAECGTRRRRRRSRFPGTLPLRRSFGSNRIRPRPLALSSYAAPTTKIPAPTAALRIQRPAKSGGTFQFRTRRRSHDGAACSAAAEDARKRQLSLLRQRSRTQSACAGIHSGANRAGQPQGLAARHQFFCIELM